MKQNLKYVVSDKDRHGNMRFYYRAPGMKKVRLRSKPGTPEFLAEYQAAVAKPVTLTSGISRNAASGGALDGASLRWLVCEYKKSSMWSELSPKTRKDRARIIDRFLMNNGDGERPYKLMERRHMLVRRDAMKEKPAAANTMVKTMKQVFAYAMEYKDLEKNPCERIRRLSEGPGYHTWTQEEIALYRDYHKVGSKARLAMELALEYSQRISDVHRLGPQFLTADGSLRFTQKKNEERKPVAVEVPIPDYLQELIDATPTGERTYIVTDYGKPFSLKGLSNKFRNWCDAAGLPKCCAMHGLRKAGSVAMAEGGATPHQLMAVTGHRTLAEAQRYTEEANRRELARQEFARRELERKKVPLLNSDHDGGTNPGAEPLENNVFLKNVAARRGVEPLFSG